MAKTKEKDALIDQLLAKVAEKKQQIEKIKNPVFKTNLSFPMEMFGNSNRINLNVVSIEVLLSLVQYLDNLLGDTMRLEAQYDVKFPNQWYGFPIEDWLSDIVLTIKKRQSQTQVAELKAIETKLNSLISEDKKKDIELANLKDLLNA
jgi:hypothetical protein